jgi:hypothetical protein
MQRPCIIGGEIKALSFVEFCSSCSLFSRGDTKFESIFAQHFCKHAKYSCQLSRLCRNVPLGPTSVHYQLCHMTLLFSSLYQLSSLCWSKKKSGFLSVPVERIVVYSIICNLNQKSPAGCVTQLPTTASTMIHTMYNIVYGPPKVIKKWSSCRQCKSWKWRENFFLLL